MSSAGAEETTARDLAHEGAVRPTVRKATHDDIDAMYEVWYHHETSGDPSPPRRTRPITITHDMDTGAGFVAEIDERIIGFITMNVRSNVLYVSEFFVDAGYRSDGIGRALIERAMDGNYRARHLVAEHNLPAFALYMKCGFAPVVQSLWMKAPSGRLQLPNSEVDVEVQAQPTPEVIEWDARVSGRSRREDWGRWWNNENGTLLTFSKAGKLIGYGVARVDSPNRVHDPDCVSIGPVGADTEQNAHDAFVAAFTWAAKQRPHVRTSVFSSHPAASMLLRSGMQLKYVATYMSDGHVFDPRCYSPSDNQL